MKLAYLSAFALVSIGLAGCSSSSGGAPATMAPSDANDGADSSAGDDSGAPAGEGGTASTPAPDGGGVCCPITALAGCETPSGYFGGWVARANQCTMLPGYADGPPIVRSTDTHGCPVLMSNQSLPMDQWCGVAHLPDASTD